VLIETGRINSEFDIKILEMAEHQSRIICACFVFNLRSVRQSHFYIKVHLQIVRINHGVFTRHVFTAIPLVTNSIKPKLVDPDFSHLSP
jgi:hypothetical protein